jgi:serine/threonine protein phosphatase 1
VQVANGCAATFRSFTGGAVLGEDETVEIDEYPRLLDVPAWFPRDVFVWMKEQLELFYEDEHAIYVHAGLERDGDSGWKLPSDSDPQSILWMRDPSFYKTYKGKRLIFGHNPVSELPVEDSTGGAWVHGDLVGLDTGSGKGGFLSALELPAMKLYESR